MRIIEHFTKINSLDVLCQPFNTKFFIAPNNSVLLLRTDYQTSEQYSTIFDQNGTYLCSWLSYFTLSKRYVRIDTKIVHSARDILKQRNQRQSNEKKTREFNNNRTLKLESEMRKLVEMLEKHDENVTDKFKKFGNKIYPRKTYF